MRAYNQRLGFEIGDTSDAEIALHLMNIFLKFGTEGRVLDVMYGSIETFLLSVYCESASSGSQVRVVICTEEQVKHTIFSGCNSKKTAH